MDARRSLFLGASLLGVSLVACSKSSDAPARDGSVSAADATASGDASAEDAGPPLPSEVTFPAGFLWGTSTAAFQVEANDSNVDWAQWAATPGKIANGDNPNVGGDDALDHIDDDVALMQQEGHTAYRFSVEWGRLYPDLNSFLFDAPDASAVASYQAILTKLAAAHITPMVTLDHYALPSWLEDPSQSSSPQGWENQNTSDYFVQFCTRMGARWGGLVDYWITINEPVNLVLGGYVQGSFPPGVVLDMTRAFAVVRAEATAHARCYDALHAADTTDADGDGNAALVSFAAHQRTFHPYDPLDPADVAATARVHYIVNNWFLNAVVKGNWDDDFDDFDGQYTGPNDKVGDPTLKGRLDFTGVNYYSDTIVSASRGVILPVVNASVTFADLPTKRPKTDFNWDIYPEGFGAVLDEAASYGLPIFVTENGIADRNDVMRGRFLAEHLLELGAANLRGDDIKGYFHWSLLDNFEWNSGYCPHFGLHSVDPATAQRVPRASASLYSSIIRAGKVTQAQIDAMPPYGAPTLCSQ
jgi:beta-glucosidase/6-phospho-beta-glucosidase/beta-galactosidase